MLRRDEVETVFETRKVDSQGELQHGGMRSTEEWSPDQPSGYDGHSDNGSDNDSDSDSDSEISTVSTSSSDDEDDELEEELDLGSAILKEIREETYICLVCTSEIAPDERFWPCSDCHRVYHISCISSWSIKGSSTDEEGNWKCPACHSTHGRQKFQYKCWCKKVLQPQQSSLNPGSCGQTCGAQLKGCPHKCSLPCHPGPHAECNALGPIMKCRCGKHDNQWPCMITPYLDGWDCHEQCEELYACEAHQCGKECHDGLCGKCPEYVESLCYCGKTKDMIKCHLKVPKTSYGKVKSDNWVGFFKCSRVSPLTYDCGVHSTDRECQPVQQKPPICPLNPSLINTCHCGQTTIQGTRTLCTDPIPTCDLTCNKELPCGHFCPFPCHEGECSPCFQSIKSKCQCGLNTFTVPCKFIQQGHIPTCTRKCTALLSCRRHRCTNKCCEDEQLAITRERLRKKGIRNNTLNTTNTHTQQNDAFIVEASHVCLQTCNKKLTCGNPDHICKRTCHAGSCPPCLESTNDDLVCHCTKTVVMAPIRCGTKLPPCPNQCIRELSCGHPQIPHNCHEGDVNCPKCTYTLEKWCNCGKNKVRALCFQDEVFCADKCGKLLSCQHHCLTSCHKGPCKCSSICGKKKKYCDHVDKTKCHFPSRCDDSKPCKEEVQQTCKCGRLKKMVWCNADSSHPSALEVLLPCDVSCVLKERQEKLEEAFGVTSKAAEDSLSLEELEYPVHALKTASLQKKWCLSIESLMKEFMANDKASLLFKPMRREQREFVHEMAETYGLYSESQDPEPYRSVFVRKTQNCKAPKYSLTEAIEAYEKHTFELKKKKVVRSSSPEQETSSLRLNQADYNAIIVENCVVGVTRHDLEDVILPLFNSKELKVQLKWIAGDKYMIIPEAFMRMSKATESALKEARGVLDERLRVMYLANKVSVVSIDQEYRVSKVMPESENKIVEEKQINESDQDNIEENDMERPNGEVETRVHHSDSDDLRIA